MTPDTCIQCGVEAGHGVMLLTRARPMKMGDYQICFGCAKRVKREQESRATP